MTQSPVRVLALSTLFALSSLAVPMLAASAAAKPVAKAAPVTVALKAADGAKLTVTGTSTIHGWHADALAVTITAELNKGGDILTAIQTQGLSKLELVAGAGTLHSPEGKSMDHNIAKALEADKFPSISFSLSSYELQGTTVTAKGTLSIHGQSKDVELPGTLIAKDGGVAVKGSLAFKMTDYGVKPPTAMLGAIRSGDAITIDYDFTLLP